MGGKKNKKKNKNKQKGAAEAFSLFDYLLEKYGPVMRTADAAKVIGCHPTHVRAMCQVGDLPAVKVGKRWLIPTHRLAMLLDGKDDAYDC